MKRWILSAAWAAIAWWWASSALADGPAWRYRVRDVVAVGQPAALFLSPANDVSRARIALSPLGGAKGRKRNERVPYIAGGSEHVVEWKVPRGRSRWKLILEGTADEVTTTAEFEVIVHAVPPFDVRVNKADVSLDDRRIVVVPNRPLGPVDVLIRGPKGETLIDTRVEVPGTQEGKPAQIVWDDTGADDETITTIDLKLHDEHGFWVAIRLEPFWIEIPHEDVVFESAKWEIRPAEAPKLDLAIEELRKQMAGRAGDLEARLYIAGYTDTVGSPADNQALSDKRARAIAAYFRRAGVTLPIFHQGFGERGLAVATPDETDELRNRRAAYVLAAAAPRGSAFPGRNWHRLR